MIPDAENKMKGTRPYLYMKVVDLTRFDSMVVYNPNRDIIEDRKSKNSLSFKDINTVLTRMKILIYLGIFLKAVDRHIIYFDYPRYSKFWCVVSFYLQILNSFIVSDIFFILFQSELPFDIPDFLFNLDCGFLL